MKTKAIIITGLPGTGKSTVAKALSKATDWMHLNTDILRDELGLRGEYDEASKTKVYKELFAQIASRLPNENLIIDGTFYRQDLRKRLIELITKISASPIWVETTCSEDLIRERTSINREYSEANFDVYLKIKAEYIPVDGAIQVDTSSRDAKALAQDIIKALSL